MRADAWITNVALVAIVVIASVFVYQHTDAQTARVADETHTWACAYKEGIRQDYLATRDYIVDVRHGRRELLEGITMADLIAAQQRRLARLEETTTLDCS